LRSHAKQCYCEMATAFFKVSGLMFTTLLLTFTHLGPCSGKGYCNIIAPGTTSQCVCKIRGRVRKRVVGASSTRIMSRTHAQAWLPHCPGQNQKKVFSELSWEEFCLARTGSRSGTHTAVGTCTGLHRHSFPLAVFSFSDSRTQFRSVCSLILDKNGASAQPCLEQ
jgi:hypothetical protein